MGLVVRYVAPTLLHKSTEGLVMEIPSSVRRDRSQITLATAITTEQYSTSVLEQGIIGCFQEFHENRLALRYTSSN